MWLPHLAGGNEERMKKYEENGFAFGKQNYNFNEMLGLFVPEDEKPIVRALVLNGAYVQADAYGWSLGGEGARLVGVRGVVAPEGRAPVSTSSSGSLDSRVEAYIAQHKLSAEDIQTALETYVFLKQKIK